MECTILIAEDDNNDRWFGALAFEHLGLGKCLHFVTDGEEAVDYLQGSGKYSDRSRYPLPDLIILDINLPRLSGIEVLKWIRANPVFAKTPAIIFTSSSNQRDISAAREAGANDYLVKPLNLSGWRDAARLIQSSWLAEAQPISPSSSPGQSEMPARKPMVRSGPGESKPSPQSSSDDSRSIG